MICRISALDREHRLPPVSRKRAFTRNQATNETCVKDPVIRVTGR